MIGGQGAYARHSSDFYETPPEATRALLGVLDLQEGTRVWEPAVGAGAISLVLDLAGMDVTGTDIRAQGVDFLQCEPIACDWIITNPPFNLANEFVRRAWSIDVPFAFLLKATFWNTKRTGELFRDCPADGVYPLTWRPAMAPDRGSSPTMDFSWVVWRSGRKEFRPVSRG